MSRLGFFDLQNFTNDPGMSMKTKEDDKKSEAGADVALERLRCAEGAGRSGCAIKFWPVPSGNFPAPLFGRGGAGMVRLPDCTLAL